MTGRALAPSKTDTSVRRRIACTALPVMLLFSSNAALAQGFQSFGQGFGQSLQQGFGQTNNNPFDNPNLVKKAPKLPEAERTLEDFFPKTEVPYVAAPPYLMSGLTVPGLDTKYLPVLSQNLFVVVENPPYSTMSELYKDNRLKGKSSFVTADCIVHPYFALQNKILRDAIYEKVMPGLSLMLQGMLKVAASDYQLAQDDEVQNDISKNIAYILVALKLLDPALKLPDMGTATVAADAELKNISAGKIAKSALFGNQEEYACFRPTGFYDREAKLKNFYRCRQWVSRIAFPLTDSDLNDSPKQDKPESRFRQSVLLFRCLDKATVNGAPAMEYWGKFYKIWQMMGARENAHEHPLLPPDYKAVFRTSEQDFNHVVQGLSEPFFRTKLLLSIRKNRPIEINSSSILIAKKRPDEPVDRAVFRLLPLADEPELPWLQELAQNYTIEKSASEATPFGLLELFARGSTYATNVLCGINWKLDADLFNSLPKLMEVTGRKRATPTAALDAGSQEGRWLILSNYFKPMTESTQPVLKTDPWMRRRLLSAFAGWVDSHVALMTPAMPAVAARDAPLSLPEQGTNSGGATSATGTAQSDAAGASTVASTTAHKGPPMNFLEPAPSLYKSLKTKTQQTLDDLSSIQYLSAQNKQSSLDLINLCQKLEEIARKELSNNFVSVGDSHFLGNIDEELDKFPAVLQASMHLETNTLTDKSGKPVSGANLSIGKPGLIFMLLRLGRGETLSRGAVYTTYEMPGPSLKPEHLERKLKYGTALPPRWTADFEVLNEVARE